MISDGQPWITNAKQTTPVNKEPDWKKCKLLGSLPDTSADITRRKMITFKNIFDSHKLKTDTKVRTFNTYVATIFLYISETWTVTQTLENQIDSCHRRLLREAIGGPLPENHYQRRNIYRVTKAEPWSRVIKRKRLRWLGHVMRLEDDTPQSPAKQALQEFLRPVKKPRGRPTTTWLKKIASGLSETKIRLKSLNLQNFSAKCDTSADIWKPKNKNLWGFDRNQWRKQVKVVMDDNHPNVHFPFRVTWVSTPRRRKRRNRSSKRLSDNNNCKYTTLTNCVTRFYQVLVENICTANEKQNNTRWELLR